MFKRGKVEDSELIRMISLGGKAMNHAIQDILHRYAEKITGYLIQQQCEKEEAEDILYEGISVFMMNVRSGKFEQKSSIYTYLVAICKRIWYKKLNRRELHRKWEHHEINQAETYYEQNTITAELTQGLEVLMSHLKEKCREVLRLWSMNYSMKEIGDQLGYSNTQVVMNKKNLCLKSLRKHLKDHPQLMELIK